MTYSIRSLTRDDFPRIIEIMSNELNNPPTVEQLTRQEDNLPEGAVFFRTGAFNDDYNNFTGVHRDYRGRGLAQAVKLLATEYALAKGAAFIRTNNHSVNERMLAVNRKMGYQPEPGMFMMVKDIEA